MSKEKDTAIDLYELYKSVYEDMVASAPAGGDGGGEVASPATGQADGAADIVQDTGVSVDDIFGKCDHEKDGFLGKDCYHIPSRVGGVSRRFEKNLSAITNIVKEGKVHIPTQSEYSKITKELVEDNWSQYMADYLTEILNGEYQLDTARDDILSFDPDYYKKYYD